MQKKDYSLWADITRILAIYLVVVVHSTSFSSSLFPFFSFAISKTSIPLFLMLSGALLLPKKESYSVFFQKRLSRIVLPWVIWSVVYFIFLIKSGGDSFISIRGFIKGIEQTMIGYWYMPMIIGIYCITPALRTFVHAAKRYEIIFVISLWFITISLLPFSHDTLAFPFHSENSIVKQILFYVGYFLFGYLVTTYDFPKKTPLYAGLIFILGILSTLLLCFPFQTDPLNLKYYEYISPSIAITSGAVFVLIYSYFNQEIVSEKTKAIIHSVSETTYGIFFLHIIIIKFLALPFMKQLVPMLQISYKSNELFLGCVYFIISYMIILCLSFIPNIKRIIS